jgi:hypothetical protein
MTLLAWTAWLAGDTAMARIVLGRTLELDPDYTLAQLLHESLNGGLLPDRLLETVRRERAARSGGPDGPDQVPVAEALVIEAPSAAPPGGWPEAGPVDDHQDGALPGADGPAPAPHRRPGRRLQLRARRKTERQADRRGRAVGG